MNTLLSYGIIFLILLALELVYFRVADHFNIIDRPNERSSEADGSQRMLNALQTGTLVPIRRTWI